VCGLMITSLSVLHTGHIVKLEFKIIMCMGLKRLIEYSLAGLR
jgi:hypothetical protein